MALNKIKVFNLINKVFVIVPTLAGSASGGGNVLYFAMLVQMLILGVEKNFHFLASQ